MLTEVMAYDTWTRYGRCEVNVDFRVCGRILTVHREFPVGTEVNRGLAQAIADDAALEESGSDITEQYNTLSMEY